MAQVNLPSAGATKVETIEYKPLAVPAVLGFVAGAAFLLISIVLFYLAWKQSTPFFLPSWMYGLTIAGVVLSALGLWQVGTSEGTRAGAKIGKWGLGISLVGGLAYFTYVTFTGLAIAQQANRVIAEKSDPPGFLQRILGSEIDLRTAFLMTRDDRQGGIKPQNNQDFERIDLPFGNSARGLYTMFCDAAFVRAMRAGDAKSVTWEALPVSEWTFESGAYKIKRSYRITTDEIVFDVPLLATSTEPTSEGEQRTWKVETVRGNILLISRTPLGAQKQAVRQKTTEFVTDNRTGWLSLFQQMRFAEAYLLTQPTSERAALADKLRNIYKRTSLVTIAGVAAGGAITMPQDDALAVKTLPEYKPAPRISEFFDVSNFRCINPAWIPRLKLELKQALSPQRASLLTFKSAMDDFAPYEIKNGQALVSIPFELMVSFGAGPEMPHEWLFLGRVVVGAPENVNVNAADADRQFRIVRGEIYRALPVPQKKQQ